MRLLTNIISVGFLSNGVGSLSLALARGTVVLEIGSHSKIGGPDLVLRNAVQGVRTRELTTQLIIVTVTSVDMEEHRAF